MSGKRRVFLIHKETVPHYRVPIYNYLAEYLAKYGYTLTVITEGYQKDGREFINHVNIQMKLAILPVIRVLFKERPNIVIFFIGLKQTYLFPTLGACKILRIRTIHWGHGRDLEHPDAKLKNFIHGLEQLFHDAIILYSESLRAGLWKSAQKKAFVANNTLAFPSRDISDEMRNKTKEKYNIKTSKNILFMGRVEKRKRLADLFAAFRKLQLKDVGLIIAGPDPEGILDSLRGSNIYKLGPVYGQDRLALLSLADVFCLPGHVGLSIVDAFWFGLPIITEDVRHAPEIMYLKNGINGFIVRKDNIGELATKLELVLKDDSLRNRFSAAARREIMTSGHIDRMCLGFKLALDYVESL